MRTKIVEELVRLGNFVIDEILSDTIVNSCYLTEKMSNFMTDLISVKDYHGGLEKVFIACDSITPGTEKPFGIGKRDVIPIGEPLLGLYNYDQLDEFVGEISLNGEKGLPSKLFPTVLTDSYGDGHHLICIDKFGRVVEFIPELDTEDVSILANSQDEFVDKLRIICQIKS